MRHGVMGMDDIEPLFARDAHEGVGQREQVLRLAEQRVRRCLDRGERQPRHAGAPPERRLAADDVDVMTAAGERVRQFRGDHAAAADRGVAHHPDVHGSCFNRPGLRIGSRTTIPSANATPARAPNCASRLSMSCLKMDEVRRVATAPVPPGANWLA